MAQDLLKAYYQALYGVRLSTGEITLKVGERNQRLIDLLQQYQFSDWAYLTAANPKSELLNDEENNLRNQNLTLILNKEKYLYFEGEGRSSQGTWPAEKSFLVLGISAKKACQLGKCFQQNAILIGTSLGIPVLRILV